MSRAELGLGISHETRYVLKSRLSRIVPRRARMPTRSGAKPEPVPSWPPPVDRENELPPTGGATGAGAGCGVPSEGCCSWVPLVELVEELTGEPPVRDPKISAATLAAVLAAVLAALWTVPAALAAVVPRLDGRRNAPPTEAGTVCTGAEGVKPAAGLASAGVGRRPPSPRGAAGEAAGSATSPRTSPASPDAAGSTCSEAAAGPGTGSTGSGAGPAGADPDAYPSSAAAGAAGVGVGSTTSGEAFDIGLGSST